MARTILKAEGRRMVLNALENIDKSAQAVSDILQNTRDIREFSHTLRVHADYISQLARQGKAAFQPTRQAEKITEVVMSDLRASLLEIQGEEDMEKRSNMLEALIRLTDKHG